MVCQIAGDALNADTGHAIVAQDPLGSLGTGDPADGKLLGILLKSGVDTGTGPQGQNHTGQYQNQIGPVETVIVGHKNLLIMSFRAGAYTGVGISWLNMRGLHGLVERIGDGGPEQGIGLGMECVQCAGG